MKPTCNHKEEIFENQSNHEQKYLLDENQKTENEIWSATLLLLLLSSVMMLLSSLCQLLSTTN